MWPMERSVAPPHFANPFRKQLCHGEKLIRLLIEGQVVITKVRPDQVSMKILRLT